MGATPLSGPSELRLLSRRERPGVGGDFLRFGVVGEDTFPDDPVGDVVQERAQGGGKFFELGPQRFIDEPARHADHDRGPALGMVAVRLEIAR